MSHETSGSGTSDRSVRPRRSSSSLMSRRLQQPVAIDKVRTLARMGLTASEVAAWLGCSAEQLRQSNMLGVIREANAAGLLDLIKAINRAAHSGSFPATKFLLQHHERVRLFDLENVTDYLQELYEEYFKAREAGLAERLTELSARIDAAHEFARALAESVGELRAAPLPTKRRQRRISLDAERLLAKYSAGEARYLEQLTVEELEATYQRICQQLEELEAVESGGSESSTAIDEEE